MKFNKKGIIKINRADRMWFLNYWANYVRTHTDKEWSRQQNILINSMIENAENFPLTPMEYLKLKGEIFK